MTGDAGPQVLKHVHEQMKIDREWSVKGRRQFVWWGHRLAQRVWADPPFEDEGMVITRLHARTDLIDDFRPDPRRLGALAAFMRLASLSGLVRDARHPDRLQLALSLPAPPGTPWHSGRQPRS